MKIHRATSRLVLPLVCVLQLLRYGEAQVGALAVSAGGAFAFPSTTNNPFTTPSTNTAYSTAITPDGLNMYIGGLKGGLAWFKRDANTGALTFSASYTAASRPTALATVEHISISGTGAYMAVCGSTYSPYGTLGLYALGSDGTPRFLQEETISTIKRCQFSTTNAQDLYLVVSDSQDVEHWQYFIDSTGLEGFSFYDSESIDGTPSSLSESPDGLHVYVHDPSTATNFHFTRSATTGSLTPAGTLAGDPGLNGSDGLGTLSDFVFKSDGTAAYALEIQTAQLVTFARSTTTGAITVGSKTTLTYSTGANLNSLSADAGLLLSPDGNGDLYLLGAALGQLGRYSASSTGITTLVSWTTLSTSPKQLSQDPTGLFLYATFANSNTSYKYTGMLINRTGVTTTAPVTTAGTTAAPTTSTPTTSTPTTSSPTSMTTGTSAPTVITTPSTYVPTTSAPTLELQTFTVSMLMILSGESVATFGSDEQTAFISALASITSIPTSSIMLLSVTDTTSTTRRKRMLRGSRYMSSTSSGINVSVSISGLSSQSAADSVVSTVATASADGSMLQALSTAYAAAGIPASDMTTSGFTYVDSSTTTPPPVTTQSEGSSVNTAAVASSVVILGVAALAIVAYTVFWRVQKRKKDILAVQAEEEKFRTALLRDPKDAVAHSNYGHFLQHQRHDYAGAERHYRLAITHDPRAAYAWNCIGHLLQHVRKDIDAAENAFREAIRLQPTNADAFGNLGYLLQHEKNDAVGAEQCYRSAIAFDSDNGLAYYNLGFLLEKNKNDLVGAETAYREALRCCPEDMDAQKRLDKVLAAKGETEVDEGNRA